MVMISCANLAFNINLPVRLTPKTGRAASGGGGGGSKQRQRQRRQQAAAAAAAASGKQQRQRVLYPYFIKFRGTITISIIITRYSGARELSRK